MGNSNSHDNNGTIVKKVKVKKTKSYSQSKKNFKSTSELRIVVIGPKGKKWTKNVIFVCYFHFGLKFQSTDQLLIWF